MNKEHEQWLTGFFEGDGCVGTYNHLMINFVQKERDVLDYIASLTTKGIICRNGSKYWQLSFNGHDNCAPLIALFLKHVVSLHACERLNAVLEHLLAVSHEPTLDWLTGFWDAEGTSSNTRSLKISQKERNVLDAIRKTFGGNICELHSKDYLWYQWYLSGDKAYTLAQEISIRSRCPLKAERLHNNFEGPSHHELHREEKKAYDAVRYDKYYTEHAEERRAYHAKRYARQKLTLEYAKRNP